MTSIEYETHIEDMAGDWIAYPRPTLAAALATARQARDELGARAQIWQREPGGDWVHVRPRRRWWLRAANALGHWLAEVTR